MGQNEYGGAKQFTGNFILYAKIKEPMMKKKHFYFSIGIGRAKLTTMLS